MPFEIDLGGTLIGYAVSAAKPGESVSVCLSEFVSTEDGQHFIDRVETLANDLLARTGARVRPSQVDNLLAIVKPDAKATVYVNELDYRFSIRASRGIRPGELVSKDDIVEILRLELGEIVVPPDCGVVALFSVGWRKAFFYDFAPLDKELGKRIWDVGNALGRMYAYLLFQERFRITAEQWNAIFDAKWFPFIALKSATIAKMLDHVRAGWDLDELTKDIAADVLSRLDAWSDAWKSHGAFIDHLAVLERAIERYKAGDFISASGLLYPRIEGLMRSHHTLIGDIARPESRTLTSSAIRAPAEGGSILLLPEKFKEYLTTVFFRHFDARSIDLDVSRHTVAHGVASAERFSKKAATIAVLIVAQLFFAFDSGDREEATRARSASMGEGES